MNQQVIALYVAAIVAKKRYKQMSSQIATQEFDYKRVHLVLSALADFGNKPEKKAKLEEYLSKCIGENAWKQLVYAQYQRLGFPVISTEVLL